MLTAGVVDQSLRRVSLVVLLSYLSGLASGPPGWVVPVLAVGSFGVAPFGVAPFGLATLINHLLPTFVTP